MVVERQVVIAYEGRHDTPLCHLHLGQIIELVDLCHADAHGAWRTVSAVGAEAARVVAWGRGEHARVVALLLRGVAVGRIRLEVRHAPKPAHHAAHGRARERIVEAHGWRHCHAKGATLGVEQASARKGLHHRQSHVRPLAGTIELEAVRIKAGKLGICSTCQGLDVV